MIHFSKGEYNVVDALVVEYPSHIFAEDTPLSTFENASLHPANIAAIPIAIVIPIIIKIAVLTSVISH